MTEQKGRWVTIEGRHIFIKNGESLDEAFKRATGQEKQIADNEDRKDRQIENNKKQADELNAEKKKRQDGTKKGEYAYIQSKDLKIPDWLSDKPKREKGEHEKEVERQIRVNAVKYKIPDPDDEEAVRKYREAYLKRQKENEQKLEEARRKDEEEAEAKRKAEDKARREKYKDVDPKSRYKTSPNSLVYSDSKGTTYVNGEECAVERAKMPLKEGGWKYVYRVAVPSTKKWNEYNDDSNDYFYGDTVDEAVSLAEKTKRT